MKKIFAFSLSILLLLGLSACGKKTHIVFPFAASDVTKVEAIYKDGESEAKEKTIIDEEEINRVYKAFSEIPVKEKRSADTDPLGTVMFAFYLKDETIYKINYLYFAVKNGRVLSEDGGFDYFTISDLIGLWGSISGESEVADTPDVLSPAIMINGVIYYSQGKVLETAPPEESYSGHITSVVSEKNLPSQNGEANIQCIDAPYVVVDEGVAVCFNQKWMLFEILDNSMP